MIEVVVTERDGSVRTLAVTPGTTVLELARREDLALEGTCGGQMACATCHVVVDPAWVAKLPSPSPEERDMLELAHRPTRHSRLGCQIRLTTELHGLAFRVIGQ